MPTQPPIISIVLVKQKQVVQKSALQTNMDRAALGTSKLQTAVRGFVSPQPVHWTPLCTQPDPALHELENLAAGKVRLSVRILAEIIRCVGPKLSYICLRPVQNVAVETGDSDILLTFASDAQLVEDRGKLLGLPKEHGEPNVLHIRHMTA